jgi:hypothetical protein
LISSSHPPRAPEASPAAARDPDAEPSWQTGASRALAILSEQSLFDDMHRIEKDNSRIEWAERLAVRLGEKLDDEAASNAREFIAEVGSARAEMRADERYCGRDDADGADGDTTELLRRALG